MIGNSLQEDGKTRQECQLRRYKKKFRNERAEGVSVFSDGGETVSRDSGKKERAEKNGKGVCERGEGERLGGGGGGGGGGGEAAPGPLCNRMTSTRSTTEQCNFPLIYTH